MAQRILSTLENKIQQKKGLFYSSSTVFWGILDREKNIDSSISFLNHFLLKRDIKSVTLRLSVRELSGELVKENFIEINSPKTYTFPLSKILPEEITRGEYSIFAEFISNENLAIPFCAVSMIITSPNTIDHVHTYGRAIEVNEINTQIDFSESFESGWTIHTDSNIYNFAILHTGRLFSEVNISLKLFKRGKEFYKNEFLPLKLNPFSTLKIDLNGSIQNHTHWENAKKIILESNYGEIDAKIKIRGLKGTFPRMLFVAVAKSNSKEKATSINFDYINFTHSNFDFDNAEQPKSSKNFGYINNPDYPNGIEKSGFRYYPCKDLTKIFFEGEKNKINTLPVNLPKLSSTKIKCEEDIPSRIVGTNWVKWKKSPIICDCSTGTYIIEYSSTQSYWHWGLLNPDPNCFESIISLLNPFFSKDKEHNFKLNLYDATGLIFKKDIRFSGKSYSIRINKDNLNSTKEIIWYSLIGEGAGSFNIFSTIYFIDKSDGSTEHSF